MKVKYRIYPLPNGRWQAIWELTKPQAVTALNLAWYGIRRPTGVSVWPWKKREDEKVKLEKACEKYAKAFCEYWAEEREANKLREESPVTEYGCEADT